MQEIISLKLNKYQACMIITNVNVEHVENIAIKLLQSSQPNDYIISRICFIVMNLRSSIKSSKLKMLDDHVHNMVMNLNLNKFPLSPSTHQNLFKLL